MSFHKWRKASVASCFMFTSLGRTLAAIVQNPAYDKRGEYEKRKAQAQALIARHC